MNDLKNIATFLKENVVLILVIIYSISFINYYLFYNSFSISIFNYVGLNDLIFFPIEYAFKIFLFVLLIETVILLIFSFFWFSKENFILLRRKEVLFYLSSNKRNRERIRKVLRKHFDESLIETKWAIVMIGIFAVAFLPYRLILFPVYLIYFIYLFESTSKEKQFGISISFAIVILVISLIFSTLYNSYSKRFEKEDYTISFKENDNLITTEKGKSTLNYLGETSTNIFLYDIESKKAKIYNKSIITEFEIQNTSTIDDYLIIAEKYGKRVLGFH